MAAAEVDLVSSLHLHNTTFAGLLQKPGPHSANPAAFFTGTSVFSASAVIVHFVLSLAQYSILLCILN